jgi:hypothetical protein
MALKLSADDLVCRAGDIQISANRATLEGSATGNMDAYSGKERFQFVCGHILSVRFYVDNDGIGGKVIRAAGTSRSARDFQTGRFENAGVFVEIVFGVELHGNGNRRR